MLLLTVNALCRLLHTLKQQLSGLQQKIYIAQREMEETKRDIEEAKRRNENNKVGRCVWGCTVKHIVHCRWHSLCNITSLHLTSGEKILVKFILPCPK